MYHLILLANNMMAYKNTWYRKLLCACQSCSNPLLWHEDVYSFNFSHQRTFPFISTTSLHVKLTVRQEVYEYYMLSGSVATASIAVLTVDIFHVFVGNSHMVQNKCEHKSLHEYHTAMAARTTNSTAAINMGRSPGWQNDTWLHDYRETSSTLLALCEGNSVVISGFPSQRPVMWSFYVIFDTILSICFSLALYCGIYFYLHCLKVT